MSEFFSGLFDGKTNLSIASLPGHLLLAAIPHWYSIYKAESNKVQGGWSNENPRAFVARLNARAAAGKKLSDLEELILRGQSAQQNAFEWWPVWAVAVVCCSNARSSCMLADNDSCLATSQRFPERLSIATPSSTLLCASCTPTCTCSPRSVLVATCAQSSSRSA